MSRRSAFREGFGGVALLLCLGVAVWAQEAEEPNPSLGDLARQTRAQHNSADHGSADQGAASKAQSLADEMQQEEEASEAAPTGFKSYDAGDYRLFVPFPNSLEGRDNGGAVLLGSRLGITNTEVLAGASVPIPSNLSDSDLMNRVRQLAGLHGGSAYCSEIKTGTRKAFRCSWSGNPYLLGRVVWGSMEVIAGSDRLIPVMCVSPDDMHVCTVYDTRGHNTCSDRNAGKSQAAIQAGIRDERTTFQVCEQIIYPSIQLKEDIVVHPATIPEGKTAKPAPVTTVSMAQESTLGEPEQQGASLADVARQIRQTPRSKAQAKLDNAEGADVAPPGFEPFTLQYCQNPLQCQEASVIIPEKAEVVSRTNGQHIFKSTLNGDPVMLYAGPADVNAPYRSLTDPDYIRMRDLANSNGWSREKADGVSTQELTIEGRPALMTRFRYQREEKTWWIGERALIQDQGAQFMVACTAPEQHFADVEALCTTLLNSLRLP
jgi:hypothetical protein